jgi:hypothetical protein
MLGFKRFSTAAVTISGIELAAKIREAPVQGREASRPTKDHSSNLGSRARSLITNPRSSDAVRPIYKFATEPGVGLCGL